MKPTFWFVPYGYLLRVQILTLVFLIGLPLYALVPPSGLLHGLFDLAYPSVLLSAMASALVTLAAVATAWTLLATTWNLLFNGPARFDTAVIARVRFPMRWPAPVIAAFAALPVVVGITEHSVNASGVSRLPLIGGAVAGLVVAALVFGWAVRTAASLDRAVNGPHPRGLARLIARFAGWLATKPNIREGYIDPHTQRLRPGHLFAAIMFALSLLLYAIVGVAKWRDLGYLPVIPTLASVLLLALLICWVAAGLAFFIDRYRIPVLVPLLLMLSFSAWWPSTDYFFPTVTRVPGTSPTAAAVLARSGPPPIVVASDGGGIQAAAWTARVLTGVVETLGNDDGERFARAIRVVSSVSGGGVGAMYFVNAYSAGHVPDAAAGADIRAQSTASSLDAVAWGAAYPDLIRLVLPLPFQTDRGQALEEALTRAPGVARTLTDWRQDVIAGIRPANIFNATIVDTGKSLAFGTTRLTPRVGLVNFEDLYPTADVKIVTAARMAATFPYVLPTARARAPAPGFHLVDGGYYDNYGMATLIQWLQEGLKTLDSSGQRPKRVLVLQIRSARSGMPDSADGLHGWLYQTVAPAKALLQVRSTGQLSHNDIEFEGLIQQWLGRVEIHNAIFTFCGDHPPLSWHLTGVEKSEIDRQWRQQLERGFGVQAVRAFLNGDPPYNPADANSCP